jgi:glucose/arabinose dehydrogenase
VDPGADYGFPRCFGEDSRPECANTEQPRVVLPTGSTPLGLAAYTSDVIPELSGSLLVALAGSNGQVELRGYALAVVRPIDTDSYTMLMPAVAADSPFAALTTDDLNYRTVGLYPARIYDVAVDASRGWVYLSLSGGRILAVRPQSEVVY